MPSIYDAFPSKYLRAADIAGRTVRVQVSHIIFEMIGQGAQAKSKPVMYFMGKEKGLALNKTNAEAIAAAYGPEMDNWQGADLELFSVMTDFAGKPTEAIRVRVPARVPPARQAAPAVQKPAPAGYSEANPPPSDDIPF